MLGAIVFAENPLALIVDPLVVASRWIHIASVIVAIGGTVFIRLILHPASTQVLPGETRQQFIAALLARWGKVLHACIGLILLTGIYNTIVQFPRHKGQPAYHGIYGIKVLLALVLFFIASALVGRSPAFEKFRTNRPMWMMVNIALAAVIVLLSNVLKNLPVTS